MSRRKSYAFTICSALLMAGQTEIDLMQGQPVAGSGARLIMRRAAHPTRYENALVDPSFGLLFGCELRIQRRSIGFSRKKRLNGKSSGISVTPSALSHFATLNSTGIDSQAVFYDQSGLRKCLSS